MNCNKIELDGAVLETYFLDASPELVHSEKRPLVLICPGGAYIRCSDREAEPIAMAFCARGFHACVLRYPCAPKRFPEQLCCLAKAVAWLRERAEQLHLDPNRITVCGFSAGGHLAASLGVFWNKDWLAEKTGLTACMMRPDRLLLGYPVISAGEAISPESFQNLLGEKFEDPRMRELVSLEKQVTCAVPPSFLWVTDADTVVPPENSLLFAFALRKANVPFELHVFSAGSHGLALANPVTEAPGGAGIQKECEAWLDLAARWLAHTDEMPVSE